MMGLYGSFSQYFEGSESLNDGLGILFEEMASGTMWVPSNCEYIFDDQEVKLDAPLSSQELSSLLADSNSLLTCGRFFCYPDCNVQNPLEIFEEFYSGSCLAVILVYDASEFELYAKDKDYIRRCEKRLNNLRGNWQLEPICEDSCFRNSFTI